MANNNFKTISGTKANDMKDFQTIALQNDEIILSNANIILEDEVIHGSVFVKEGKIADIGQGMVVPKGAVDCKGDYISAGLVELHTDNLERHMQPRPGVKWPMKAAILSHDAELASVGITTVFDALRVGSITSDKKSKYEKYARVVATDIVNMHATDQLRVSHFIHLRAEVCTETLLEEMGEFTTDDRIGIVSIMDHTPGQRQFRDLSKMEEYLVGKYSLSKQDVLEHFDKLYSLRDQYGVAHEAGAARIGKELGAVLASHDDTTLKDVETSAQKGVRIAEFPTTLEAGQECHNRNIAVMMGAPNLLRGGSHSGNVAAHELAAAGVLKILSSDYAPSSLLMAAVRLGLETGDMAQGLRTVTVTPARATGLNDRGCICQGLRADLIRFNLVSNLPSIKGVWRQGNRIA